ncbi:hypothetical protein [Geitlerinema sp. PCC 9228]|jgi:uncharacterized protein YoxC|uniref:hypothetical protein n=1 Tax=Geitlerinema sp. PCC 9228 TaxID=111611 RepID=UPI0008F9A053|nr:hypothetical protein [Geitlerinema sp. PCC 9228]
MSWHQSLKILEYVALGAAIAGTVAAAIQQQAVYAAVPLCLAIGINLWQRHRLQVEMQQQWQEVQQQMASESGSQAEQLQKLAQFLESSGDLQVQLEELGSLVDAVEKLHQRQQQLEESIQPLQNQLEMLTEQFKERPELEQINHLNSVIVDLQQFINQLPQWSNLQQQQMRELQERVDRALEEIPERVANAVDEQQQ